MEELTKVLRKTSNGSPHLIRATYGQCSKCRISGKCQMSDFGFRRYFGAI